MEDGASPAPSSIFHPQSSVLSPQSSALPPLPPDRRQNHLRLNRPNPLRQPPLLREQLPIHRVDCPIVRPIDIPRQRARDPRPPIPFAHNPATPTAPSR